MVLDVIILLMRNLYYETGKFRVFTGTTGLLILAES